MGKLTDTAIRRKKPTSKDQWLNDGAGLYLRIRKSGSRIWVIRRKRNGKTQIITLGSYPEVSLKEARLEAAQYQLKQTVSGATVEALVTKYMTEVVEIKHKRPGLAQVSIQIIPTPICFAFLKS